MLDYLIVGQGIAGSVLAHILSENGKKILVVNRSDKFCSSAVAAGIFNPITGKRMIRSWKAEVLFPFLLEYYLKLEQQFGVKLLHKLPIYKPFSSFAEQNHFLSNKEFPREFCTFSANRALGSYIFNPFGGFETFDSGFVDSPLLMSSVRTYLKLKGSYIEEPFQYHDIVIKNNHALWKGIETKMILFCEGSSISQNPFFKWLPMVLTKGEILDIQINNFPKDIIFNKSVFILPQQENIYRVGSTYEWNFTDNSITNEGRKYIENKLALLLNLPYDITGQVSGIRPTVKDRRPIIGLHPQFKTLGIFNGLGTKGISLAPYFAQHLFDFLEKEKDLDPEVNIERFYSLL